MQKTLKKRIKPYIENQIITNLVNNKIEKKIKLYLNSVVEITFFLKKFYPILKKSIINNKNILICGNGGSAADSNHFAAELAGKFKKKDRKLINCTSIVSNNSIITAIANDFSYDEIFSKQIKAIGRSGDICIFMSTSGKSKNILKGIEVCQKLNIMTVGFFGGLINNSTKKCDFKLNVKSKDTAIIQEVHLMVLHMICDLLENDF